MEEKKQILIKKAPYFRQRKRKGENTYSMNKKIRPILKFNFEDIVERKNGAFFLKGGKRPLISPTTLNLTLNKVAMSVIPDWILEQRRQAGVALMENLETMVKKRVYDTNDLLINERDRRNITNLMTFFMENNIRIEAVEKFITNGTFCGYVDMIGWWNKNLCMFEIKLRNKQTIRLTDVIQSAMYKKMLCNIPAYIILLDDTGAVSWFNVPSNRSHLHYGTFEKYLSFWKEMGIIDDAKVKPIQINPDNSEGIGGLENSNGTGTDQ